MATELKALTKEFLILFLPYFIIVTAFIGSLLYLDRNSRIDIAKESTNHHVTRHTEQIRLKLSTISGDLNYLSNMNEIKEFVHRSTPYNKSQLQQEILTFSRYKGVYDQVRLINQDGIEVIRVNYNQGNPVIVAESELQDKSNRYYFKKTITKTKGDLYISPFDLNIEQGQIEHPIKPMIRFGLPVFNNFNELKGALVVNYLGSDLLDVFNKSSEGLIGDSLFLNNNGYYIASPNADQNWRFMYPDLPQSRFQTDNQQIWNKIARQDSGQFLTEKELFTFNTISPFNAMVSEANRLIYKPTKNLAWKLVSVVQQSDPSLSSVYFKQVISGIYSFLILIGGFGCWLLARSNTKLHETTDTLASNFDELKKTQYEMIQSEKLASLGRMVAGFAHEINTPIGVAVGASSITIDTNAELQKSLKNDQLSESDFNEYMETINDSAELTLRNLQRAARLIQSFKRTSVNQNVEQHCDFDVKDLVDDVISNLRNQLKIFNIDMQLNCSDSLEIYSIPGLLEQILTNLIQNTLIHGFVKPADNQIIQISIRILNNQLAIDYFDNGYGMTDEVQNKIFEPFFTTNRSGGGTGLGLFILRNIISDQLGGDIHCTSKLDKGTNFFIRYPIGKISNQDNELQESINQTSES